MGPRGFQGWRGRSSCRVPSSARRGGASGLLNTGGRYDPVSDSWSPMLANPPLPRRLAAGVWTGQRLLVWGGFTQGGALNSGGQYDPGADSWLALTTPNIPVGQPGPQAAVWTGRELLVWGGSFQDPINRGGRYLRLHLFYKE